MDCSYGSQELSVGTFTLVLGALIAEKGGSADIFCTTARGAARQREMRGPSPVLCENVVDV